MSLTVSDPAVAHQVIIMGQQHNVYNGEMPADDAGKVTTANELLALAEQARAAGMNGAAVQAVIGAVSPEANGSPANPFAAAAAEAPPVPEPAPQPTPPAPPAPDPGAPDVNSAIPDYDDLRVADVLVAMANLTDEQIAVVKAYEAQEGERSKILTFERPPQQPSPTPAPSPGPPPLAAAGSAVYVEVAPDSYTTQEPWAGYSKAKIPEIIAAIESAVAQRGQDAKPMLAHVWAYEQATKERSRLLGKLKEIGERGVTTAVPAAPTTPPAEGADVRPTSPFMTAPVAAPASPQSVIQQPQAPAPVAVPDLMSPKFDDIVPPFEDGPASRALRSVAGEGLPIPPEIQGDPPNLPYDFISLSDIDVRRLQGQFNACQARAHWLLALSEGYANDGKLIAERALKDFIRQSDFVKGTTVTEMEARAGDQPEVQHARRVQHEWGEKARLLRALRDTYASTCDRLSREQTGRADEAATSR